MDTQALHATLQFPTAVVEFLLGAMLFMRWHAVRMGEQQRADVRIIFKLALVLTLIAVKQSYWMIEGMLRSLGLGTAANALRENPGFATAVNAAIVIVGLLAIARVAAFFIGRASYPVVIASGAMFVALGAALSTMGKGL